MGMPGPVSHTATVNAPFITEALTAISPLSVNLMALPTRLSRTWESRRSSPRPVGRSGATWAVNAKRFSAASGSTADTTPCTMSNCTPNNNRGFAQRCLRAAGTGILDGTVVRVRLDRKATSISLLVVIGVRADGQKVLLALKSMGGESTEAWRAVLDDLIKRGLRRPEFLIVDGAAGLDNAIAAVWDGVPMQRCTVHKHRNLLAHAPERLHEEISADYNDMIYAATRQEVEARRKAFIRKWRLKHRAVADSLEEAGDRLFTFTRLPPGQWRSVRTTNAIERLHEEFKRRIKTQTVLPSADTAAMLFWALLASGQINMRKVDGWQTLATPPVDQPIDLAA